MEMRPSHFEFHGDDATGLARFYARVFGWHIEQWGDVDYHLLTTGHDAPGINGATAPPQPHGQRVVVTTQTDDIDSTAQTIVEAGGEILMPKAPIPTVGWLINARDPAGTVFGVMQPDETAS